MLARHPRLNTSEYVLHTIGPGESLSALAKKYYGDFRQFALIAQYNHLQDATQIRLGQGIKVPRIDSLPFNVQDAKIVSIWRTDVQESDSDSEVIDQVAVYLEQGKELFDQAQYEEAAFEFAKVLNSQPDHPQAKHYLSRAFYQMGEAAFQRQEYPSAKALFQQALEQALTCPKCVRYIRQCNLRIMEHHYNQGVTLFEKEQPKAAIVEWRKVQAINPNFKQVTTLIKRAEKILKNLEAILREGSQSR
jgi:tetratricopeptide (TPR) repeat protein